MPTTEQIELTAKALQMEIAEYKQQLLVKINQRLDSLAEELLKRSSEPNGPDEIIQMLKTVLLNMTNADSREALLSYESVWHEILDALDIADTDNLKQLNDDIKEFVETKKIYLTPKASLGRRLGDVAWLTGGILLLAATAVFGIAFPFLSVPAIVLGAGVLAYSTLDISKEFAHLISHISMPKLFGTKKPLSTKQKIEKGAVMTASTLGFGLAVVGVLAVIPALAFPPIVPVVMAIAAIGISASLLGRALFKWRKAKKKVAHSRNNANQMRQDIKPTLETIKLRPTVDLTTGSIAKIEKGLAGHDLSKDEVRTRQLHVQQSQSEGDSEGESDSSSDNEGETVHEQPEETDPAEVEGAGDKDGDAPQKRF